MNFGCGYVSQRRWKFLRTCGNLALTSRLTSRLTSQMVHAWCWLLHASHVAYIALTYFVLPVALGGSRKWQIVNLVNLGILVLHWKLLGNRCILDVLAKEYCPPTKIDSSVVLDDVTFSNIIQLLLLSAATIALAAIIGSPLILPVRLATTVMTFAIALLAVPLTRIYSHKKCVQNE